MKRQAGLTLIELALAFVIRHPAVTAAIIASMSTVRSRSGALTTVAPVCRSMS